MNPLTEAFLNDWPVRPSTTAFLLALATLYGWGWIRTRRAYPKLADVRRLVWFVTGLAAVGVAMLSPLYALREELLAARAVQQILLMLVAPPLLWLACPFHVIVWGMPPELRKMVTRRLLRRSASGRLSRLLTRPIVVWLATLSLFLIWHDPQIVTWTLHNGFVYSTALWMMLGVYLLFWWHLVGTAPRIHPALPIWLALAYILLGGEIPNMVTGVTLAFRDTPAYVPYAVQSTSHDISPLYDQMVSGGIIWFMGSVIYVFSVVAMLARFFKTGDSPPQLPLHWEATERSIAPGLEHRVIPEHWRKPNEYR